MTRESYQDNLAELRADVQEMGDLVLDQLDRSLRAIETNDPELAETVIDRDETVNELYFDLESCCIDLFALQQPVASDLRFVAASFKIITDLERIGDLATNLAQYSLGTDQEWFSDIEIQNIGTDVNEMIEEALIAYETEDVERCHAIADRDDAVDALCQRASERVVRELIEHESTGTDAWDIEGLLDEVSRILLTIRDLERVGDHAVNIAGRTLYMADSDPTLIY
ncbi:MAG: phosphate signaling complex protein PhoU [Halobacteriales archaeon]